MTENRLFYVWCVLAGLVFLASIPPSNSSVYQVIATYEGNRWVHFLAYALVVAIPVAIWKTKTNILLSLLPAVVTIALETLQAHVTNPFAGASNVPADLFGLAAGVLLGMNIRVMRNPVRPLHDVGADPSNSERY